MVFDPKVEEAIDALIKSVKETECYETFEEYRVKASNDLNLRNNINRTRSIRSQLNKMSDAEKNGDAAEYLIDEYEKLLDNTAVHEFSIAEHEFSELYQNIMAKVAGMFNMDL